MLKSKSTLNLVMLFSALLGLIFVIGCAGSAEKQDMSELLKLYSKAVGDYEAADDTLRVQLEEKIDSYKLKCSDMISDMELNNKATPQVIKELEIEYKKLRKNMNHCIVNQQTIKLISNHPAPPTLPTPNRDGCGFP